MKGDFTMLLKHNVNGKSQFVYEFFTEDKYATSFEFTFPSMGIWVNHDHPWVVLMRETQRTVTTNWSDLNSILRKLIEFYEEFRSYPNKTTFTAWLEEGLVPENYTAGWFVYPDDMDY